MGQLQVGIEVAGDGKRYVTVTCPECERTNRYPFETLAPGMTLECECGVGFNLSPKNHDGVRGYGLGEHGEEAN